LKTFRSRQSIILGALVAGFFHSVVLLAEDAPRMEIGRWSIAHPTLQEDFPDLCVDLQGRPWVVYTEYDGTADTLKIARKAGDSLTAIGPLTEPGVIHQPAVACDGQGAVWAIWSELGENGRWKLQARAITDGKAAPETVTLESASGSAVFADAGTDRKGRVWVTWQSFRGGYSDIYAKHFDPAQAKWSDEIRVTKDAAGDWEPRLAFGKGNSAWIVFDSSRTGNFNVYVATVGIDGSSRVQPIMPGLHHQARPSVAAAPDGSGFWVAWESGRRKWGRNSRGVNGKAGLNWGKAIEAGFFNATDSTFTSLPSPTPALKGKGIGSLNLPCLGVSSEGKLWLASRFFRKTHWRVAVTTYDAGQKGWSQSSVIKASDFGQDRRCSWASGSDGKVWFCWPSDLRKNKKALKSGVYLARLDPNHRASFPKRTVKTPPAKSDVPLWGDSPGRHRDDRHTWALNGKKFRLYWGDFHRHTDVSNCRTGTDGCIVEQFRYAYDFGQLDFLGPSDHTDIGKVYDPYEWWCNQKLMDVFHAPGFFNSFYVYEREQRWPWGHRNVVFIERGAPIIYINRQTYKSSPWQKTLPVTDGGKEIVPTELWDLLRKSGKDVSVISHTGATRMGTNWDNYELIDHQVENLVEIYQGARVSYEGLGAPQPTVGFPRGVKLKEDAHGSVKTKGDFGPFNNGVYQYALENGHNLGVFASSDHISTHTTYGGVYTEDFSRKGILDAMNARRTIAATDKIFVEFSCNGYPLGSVFDVTGQPEMQVAVSGTAKLRRVTIVRNESNYKVFTPKGSDISTTFTDEKPLDGENRYYIRVEQEDGNMAWSSPVWVTVKK
jgi:hypothetical protein